MGKKIVEIIYWKNRQLEQVQNNEVIHTWILEWMLHCCTRAILIDCISYTINILHNSELSEKKRQPFSSNKRGEFPVTKWSGKPKKMSSACLVGVHELGNKIFNLDNSECQKFSDDFVMKRTHERSKHGWGESDDKPRTRQYRESNQKEQLKHLSWEKKRFVKRWHLWCPFR